MLLHDMCLTRDTQNKICDDNNLPHDWSYRDIPHLSKESYQTMFDVIEKNNYIILADAHYSENKNKIVYRAQLMLSPHGIKNLNAYNLPH